MKNIAFIIFSIVFLTLAPVQAANVPLTTIEQLNTSIEDKSIIVLDVRSASDWSSSKYKIKGAVRAPAKDFGIWSEQYPKDTKLVLYCA